MEDRFKFRAVLKTDKFTILVEPFYILNSCYFIDINKAEVEFECKYPDECFWDFIEEIEKQYYVQEVSTDNDLIITKDFTNLVQCTGLKDKNGKLIYEGDIVKFKSGNEYRNGKVEYSQTIWSILNAKFINRAYIGGALINMYNESEVIGNIYENPELLSEVK